MKKKVEKDDVELWLKVAWKMRDSIAVIVAGARNSTHQKAIWKNHLDFLRDEKMPVHFILWLEQDSSLPHPKTQKKREWNDVELRRSLKKSLKWLSTKVDIANINDNPFSNSLTVNYE